MDLKLRGRIALVLAGSSGLGRGVATELSREGAQVVIMSSNQEKLKAAQAFIKEQTGNQPDFVVGDLQQPEDIKSAVNQVVSRFGAIDILVTNAPGPKGGPFLSLTQADWDSAYQLSLLSHVQAIQAALPHMQANGGGRILLITSSSIRQAIDNLALSNAFRLATLGMAKTLAREVAKDGILVNVIGSGSMKTPRIDALDTQNAERLNIPLNDWRAQQEAKIPLGRYGDPLEFGRLAAFLCSFANTYITGQGHLIDGGMTTAY